MLDLTEEQQQRADELVKQFTDHGLLIAAGWAIMQTTRYPDASEDMAEKLKDAFFAGAQHLFASMLGILSDEAEPTEEELDRLDLINDELGAWVDDFAKRYNLKVRSQ